MKMSRQGPTNSKIRLISGIKIYFRHPFPRQRNFPIKKARRSGLFLKGILEASRIRVIVDGLADAHPADEVADGKAYEGRNEPSKAELT